MTTFGRGRQDAGQLGFAEVRPEAYRSELLELTNFSHALRPELRGIWPEDYADVMAEQLAFVTPELLQQSLLRKKPAVNTVFYRHPETYENIWVTVSPIEYKHLAGNLEVLGNRAVSSVLEGRQQRSDPLDKRAAASRGGLHAVNEKLDELQTYYKTTLAQEKGLLSWLKMSAEHPERKIKSMVDMRIILTSFDLLTDTTIAAISQAENWSDEKSAGVKKAVEYKLVLDRDNNRHFTHWIAFLDVAETYLGFRKALYADKIVQAQKYARTHEVPVKE